MTELMLAATYERSGDAAEVLTVREVTRPEPGPGQVRVRVAVSASNPTDVKIRSGLTPRAIDDFQVPHMDGAGTIDAVGAEVDETLVGQRVWLQLAAHQSRYGTAAQWTVLPLDRTMPLPDGVSFELGATLGVPAVTAAHCLFADGPITGRHVLVAGGAGAVGRNAIELAKWGGAQVAATASTPEKQALAAAAGADVVIDYRGALAVEELKAWCARVDRVVELDLGRNLELDLAVSGFGTTVIVYATSGPDPVLPVRRLMTAQTRLQFMLLYGLPEDLRANASRQVQAALEAGALSEPPLQRFALTDIIAAHRAQEAGSFGRILVTIP